MVRTDVRIERLLNLVPYVLSHPGVAIDELVRLFGGSSADLIRDLNTLMMTGLPPFSPGDLVEVDIDEDRGVWISMADHFSRPLRLTRTQARALYLRGTEAAAADGLPEAPALSSALVKLQDALSDELGGVAARTTIPAPAGEEIGPVATLRTAAARRVRVRIEYYAQSRDELTERVIDPEHVFWDLGSWYAIAWDEEAGGERTFRIDRIFEAELTDESFSPRGLEGPGRPMLPGGGTTSVIVRLTPSARWVCEYFGATILTESADGSVEASLTTTHMAWVVKLLLRLGTQAEVLEPPELRSAVAQEAAATLAHYS